ncbi:MAG: MFS transporter [Elusimicrobiota bacterium]
MRLLLASSLIFASWHPAAANTIAQAVQAGAGGVVAPVPMFGPSLGQNSLGAMDLSGTLLPSTLSLPRVQTASPLGAGPLQTLSPARQQARPVAAAAREPLSPKGAVSPLPALEKKVEEIKALQGSKDTEAPAKLEAQLTKVFDGGVSLSEPGTAYAWDEPAGHRAGSLSPATGPQIKEQELKIDEARKKESSRRALVATGVFKVGLEAVSLTMPLIVLTTFNSAVIMATMAAAWGTAMTLASMVSGGVIDRKPVNKVLAAALVGQAAIVAGVISLLLTGAATPLTILPLHALSGAAMGVILTCRDCIPARILGREHKVLSKFNAKTHIAYEIAGTLAPLLVGLLISKVSLAAALFIHPPAYLLAAFLYYRLKLGEAPSAPPQPGPHLPDAAVTSGSYLQRIVSDIKAGAKIMFASKELRWIALMVLGPMVVHRVFEQMVIPMFVKTVLQVPAQAAWIGSASNLGELLGALLLLQVMMGTQNAASKKRSPYHWVRPMALGVLTVWATSLVGNVWPILPLILARSLLWTASDISVTSFLQSKLPNESAGKAMGFLMALELALIMAGSYGVGILFDLLPLKIALLVVNIGFTLAALAFWKGYYELKKKPSATPKS